MHSNILNSFFFLRQVLTSNVGLRLSFLGPNCIILVYLQPICILRVGQE